MAAAKMEERVCEDVISALPDDLLVTILLRLPLKDAVATMFLSKRWRFVWTMLHRLQYEENGDGHDYSFYDYDKGDDDKSKKSIWCFLEKSMELHKAPFLEILLIKLGPTCPVDADVGKCLTKAVERGVVVLQLKLCWSAGPTRLPKSLYTCETLAQLTLSHKILVDLPSSSRLPSLNVLELFHVVYKDEASLVRFLSSCPLLYVLNVRRNQNHDNVTNFIVKVPSLMHLTYTNCNDVVDTGGSLVIDTPALTLFHIFDFSRDSWLIENMPRLDTLCIDVKYFPDIEKSITSLSRVSSFDLSVEVLVRCSTISFSRLIVIELQIRSVNSVWLEPLLLLLKNAPKVKVLLVNNVYKSYLGPIPLSWNQPSAIPVCMSSNLKTFEYREYEDREEEEKFLTYILANSKCLKTVTISVRSSFNLERRELIIEKLRNIHKVSTTSQLLLK